MKTAKFLKLVPDKVPHCNLEKECPKLYKKLVNESIELKRIKMEHRKVTCDCCDCDLTYTGNSVDWSIRLVNRSIPPRGGCVTDMMIYPDLKHDYDFCGLGCLQKCMQNDWKSNAS